MADGFDLALRGILIQVLVATESVQSSVLLIVVG